MEGLAAGLPNGDEILALWREYEDGDTAEGRFVKACDKLDMALQAQSYSAAQGLDLEEFVGSALRGLEAGVLRELATPAAT
jgi:putative hydrolase of HD superfamily